MLSFQLAFQFPIYLYSRALMNGRSTREAPAHRIIPLNVAHSAWETSQEAQKPLPLIGFLLLKAVPLIED
jgi:hypothetical protein